MSSSPSPALSVTQLLRRMKNLLEIQLGNVWVEGEVSNLRRQPSGHWYFTLKDEDAQISCVMFGAKRREGSHALADGARVKVFAEASVYEARGQLQIIILRAEAAGHGDLQRRFEELKQKLAAEGLFDPQRKQPIPRYPRTIGLVTSPNGAALQDILNVLRRRAPWVQPILFPVRVQGKGAELEIARAIHQLGNPETHGHPRCDLLIVGRGGGSLEDLWNFNEEAVARAIAACPIPIISAVGHEIDFTIADFAADLRAPTPSAAAELAVSDGGELFDRLARLSQRITAPVRQRIQSTETELLGLRRGLAINAIDSLLREWWMRVDMNRDSLTTTTRHHWKELHHRLTRLHAAHRAHHPARVLDRRNEALLALRHRLQKAVSTSLARHTEYSRRLHSMMRTLGPESAFQRGFSITTDAAGNIIRSIHSLHSGTPLVTRLADGTAHSTVDSTSIAPSRDDA